MKKLIAVMFFLAGTIAIAFSQEKTTVFEPNGKPLALIFTNFNTASTDGEITPAFEITRAYLGYEYNFNPEWYGKVVLDVGNPGAGKHEMAAFLKNAYMEYEKDKLAVSFGLISTTQFKVSEKIWGLRYIEKSFQDAYKFNSSADLGFNIDYTFSDFISADFSIINGEGYKKIQSDKLLRPGAGITVKPVKSVTARVFADYMGDQVKQQSLATFAAYTGAKLMVAGEYNFQKNFGMADGCDVFGTSFFATYKASKKLMIFGRYDNLSSSTLPGENEAWQIDSDGQLFMAGIELSPVKGVKLAPNFRLWDTASESTPNTTFFYLNCEIKF